MQVQSIAECSKEHSAILLTFIKLPFVIKIFVLSIFDWLFYTGLTVINSVDPNEMAVKPPHLGLHCFLIEYIHYLIPFLLNTYLTMDSTKILIWKS